MYDPILAEKINEILFARFGAFSGETSQHIAEVAHEYYEEEGTGIAIDAKSSYHSN
jgi:hypothetical protein